MLVLIHVLGVNEALQLAHTTQQPCGFCLVRSVGTRVLAEEGGRSSRGLAAILSRPHQLLNHAAYSSTSFEPASGKVSIKGREGRTHPLSRADHARASVNHLIQSLPLNRHILAPRTWKEAHNRPDSLCSVLGIPFAEIRPWLFEAGILLKSNRQEGLSLSLDGYQKLSVLYRHGPSFSIGSGPK